MSKLFIADFKNFTPHPIQIPNGGVGGNVTIQPAVHGGIRLQPKAQPKQFPSVGGFDIWEVPELAFVEDSAYEAFMNAKAVIVSTIVAEHVKKHAIRENVFAPSVIPEHTMRDASGRIIGILALHQYA